MTHSLVTQKYTQSLHLFAKIRSVTISFIISVHLSIRPSASDSLVPTRWILIKFVLRTVESVIVWLKSDKYIRHFTHTWHTMYVDDNILLNSSRKRNSFRKKSAEKIKTHILWSVTFWKCVRQNCRENHNTHFVVSNFF